MRLSKLLAATERAHTEEHQSACDPNRHPTCERVAKVLLLDGREGDKEPNQEGCRDYGQDLGHLDQWDCALTAAQLDQIVVLVQFRLQLSLISHNNIKFLLLPK